MAHGVADNMLITTYLSMKAPVFIAPAMECFFALKRNNIAQKVRLSTVNYEQIVRFRVVLGCFVCYA